MATNVFREVDWGKAPDWARYWTCDHDGAFWWHGKPLYSRQGGYWIAANDDRYMRAQSFGFVNASLSAARSLVKRPKGDI
jgi:hypothetical protein